MGHGPFLVSGGGRPTAGWAGRLEPDPDADHDRTVWQHLDRVAVQLGDLRVRLDQLADPQQQILQGGHVGPGGTPGTDDRHPDPAEQVEMNVGQA
jgi:hypothetical protein